MDVPTSQADGIYSDIGLPFYEEMAKGPRIVDGLFQGLAARASGLAIIPLASSSPALQFVSTNSSLDGTWI